MDTRTCKLFAEYNKKTNTEMNTFIKGLDKGQWEKEFSGYFNSIKSLCNHIYISDFNWLKRFSKLREYTFIKDPLFSKEVQFGSTVLDGISDYIAKRQELDEKIIMFTNEIVPKDLDQKLAYTDSRGVKHNRLFGGLVLHFFNHQTHHRGMISIYLENMQIANDYSNLMYMV